MIKTIVILSVLMWSALAVAGIVMAERVYKRVDDLGVLVGTRTRETKKEIAKLKNETEIGLFNLRQRIGEQLSYEMDQLDCIEDMGKIMIGLRDKIDGAILQTMPKLAVDDPEEIKRLSINGGEITLPGSVPLDDKAAICIEMKRILNMTRAGEDIADIHYEKVTDKDGFGCEEYAVITYESGYKQTVIITADSGKAVIEDVLRKI